MGGANSSAGVAATTAATGLPAFPFHRIACNDPREPSSTNRNASCSSYSSKRSNGNSGSSSVRSRSSTGRSGERCCSDVGVTPRSSSGWQCYCSTSSRRDARHRAGSSNCFGVKASRNLITTCNNSNRSSSSGSADSSSSSSCTSHRSSSSGTPVSDTGSDRPRRNSSGSSSKSSSRSSWSSHSSSVDEKGAQYSSTPVFLCFEVSPLRPDLVVAVALCEDVRNMPFLCRMQLQHGTGAAAATTAEASAPAGPAAATAAAQAPAAAASQEITAPQQAAEGGTGGAPSERAAAETTAAWRAEDLADQERKVCCVGMNPSLVVSIDQVLQGVLTAVQHWEENRLHTADLQKEILFCCSPGGRSISRALQQLGIQPQQQRLLLVVVGLPHTRGRCGAPPDAARVAAPPALISFAQQQQQLQHPTQQHHERRQKERQQQQQQSQQTQEVDSIRWWERTEGRWRLDVEQALRDGRDETALRAVAQIAPAEEALPGGLEAAVLARIAAKFI